MRRSGRTLKRTRRGGSAPRRLGGACTLRDLAHRLARVIAQERLEDAAHYCCARRVCRRRPEGVDLRREGRESVDGARQLETYTIRLSIHITLILGLLVCAGEESIPAIARKR